MGSVQIYYNMVMELDLKGRRFILHFLNWRITSPDQTWQVWNVMQLIIVWQLQNEFLYLLCIMLSPHWSCHEIRKSSNDFSLAI